jgi:hypothetical protein
LIDFFQIMLLKTLQILIVAFSVSYFCCTGSCSASPESAVKDWLKPRTFFSPNEPRLSPPAALVKLNPALLDPGIPGSFAKHTLHNRLPAVSEKVVRDGAFSSDEKVVKELQRLAEEIPYTQLKVPEPLTTFSSDESPACISSIRLFNEEWANWVGERESGDWKTALPLISTEIYFYRRLLDCTGYFRPGPNRLRDPYALQKRAALDEGLRSPALLHNIRRSTDALGDELSLNERRRLLHDLLLASLWGNQARVPPFRSRNAMNATARQRASQPALKIWQTLS